MRSQKELIFQYYKRRPNKDIRHENAVDWATAQYLNTTGKVFRDPDRAIRSLCQEGKLIKIDKGVYRYDPKLMAKSKIRDFTSKQKQKILARDDYRCVICGGRQIDGVELHIDHIVPRDKGGRSIIENGQILCSQHNYFKKNYLQTETAKRFFINLHKTAQLKNDRKIQRFCQDILQVYDKHKINGHIVWPQTQKPSKKNFWQRKS